jgi:hypothetical protein
MMGVTDDIGEDFGRERESTMSEKASCHTPNFPSDTSVKMRETINNVPSGYCRKQYF